MDMISDAFLMSHLTYLYHDNMRYNMTQAFTEIPLVVTITGKQLEFVCLFVFNVPSTARSFRDGTPISCPLRRT